LEFYHSGRAFAKIARRASDSENLNEFPKPAFTPWIQWSHERITPKISKVFGKDDAPIRRVTAPCVQLDARRSKRLEWDMKRLREFLKDRRGVTALTFALLLVPIMGMTGLVVDYSIASNERSKLQDAADAAALAGASIFTGANASAAEARARAYLKANLGAEADTIAVTFKFDAKNHNVTANLSGQTSTMFMHLLNQNNVSVGVTSTALAPLKPTTASITVDSVYGYWFKRVSIIVVRNGVEVVVGTITYTAVDHSGGGGRGTGKTVPDLNTPTTYNLGDYTKLYLKMEIKNDGCDIGYRNNSSTNIVNCVASTKSQYANYNSTLRTDDPTTVDHLFVDGTQLALGSTPPLDNLLNCDSTPHSHAWEDGGGWAQQDFFYHVSAACKSVDGENVRLTN
jgi:Flp pilus assembly protein TadG